MAYRNLEMTLISAKDLRDVNFFSRMEVYVVASVAGDPRSRQRTPADREGGRNPTWNCTLRFPVPDSDPGSLMLHLLLRSQRILGDRSVGEVHVPVRELLDAYNAAAAAATAAAAAEGGEEKKPAPAPPAQFLTYQVMKTRSGKTKGVLNISYKFSDLMEPFPAYPPPNEPVTAYPPPASSSSSNSEAPVTAYPGGYPPQHGGYGGYPAPPPQDGYGSYPAPPSQSGYGGYPAPPPQGGYGGYAPPPPQGGYGYGCPPPAGPYGYGAPPQASQPAKKNKFGMGLGAGLLGGAIGGMLLGDMVSDAAAYDAGYDAGFDDGMDF